MTHIVAVRHQMVKHEWSVPSEFFFLNASYEIIVNLKNFFLHCGMELN